VKPCARSVGRSRVIVWSPCLTGRLLVDAKQEAVGYYETFGFLRLEPVTGEAPMQPLPMFLAINKLARLAAGK